MLIKLCGDHTKQNNFVITDTNKRQLYHELIYLTDTMSHIYTIKKLALSEK